jgi:hypothetical protein
MAPGQPALIQGVLHQLNQGVRLALAIRPLVIPTQPLAQTLQRRPQHRPTLGIEQAVDDVHAIDQRADVETAAGVVGLGLAKEAVGVGDMPGIAAEEAQGGDRVPSRQAQHLRLIEAISLLTQLITEVAEQGGGLVADLP